MMKKHILYACFVLVCALSFPIKDVLSYPCTFEEAYDMAQQARIDLRQVSSISPAHGSDGWLGRDPDRKDWFLGQASQFIRLHTLDLTSQYVDDDFIKDLSESGGFQRLTSLNLTGNPMITAASLKYIFDSDSLGSLRELPQISSRYEVPASTIYITVKGTSIPRQIVDHYNQTPRFNFTIAYRRAADDRDMSPTMTGSIKWLDVKMS